MTNNLEIRVGTPRCGVPVRKADGTKTSKANGFPKILAPLNAARTARRAVPTTTVCYVHSPTNYSVFLLVSFVFCLQLTAAETNSISSGEIIFNRDVRPILEQNCFVCHGPEKSKSHFRLDNHDDALKGGDNFPDDIVPGDSSQSRLIHYVSDTNSSIFMPPDNRKPLTPEQIAVLRAWIDQGANWETNSAEWAISLTPELRWIGVHGDNKKFRELENVHEGAGGGIGNFSVNEQIAPDEKFSVNGHALLPENDFKLTLALEKKDVGFVRGGFEEWRKYYDDTGGFYPGFTPSSFSLNQDLHLDIGRAWIDFGLTQPDEPKFVLGYEYQFRQGDESTLDWGTVFQGANAKNIYPNVENINEHVHIFKVDVTDDWNDWRIEDHARVEVYHLGESRGDVLSYSSGPTPDVIERVNQSVHYTIGANTFRVEKQLKDWWLISAGSLLSRYDGASSFNQNAVDGSGAPTFGSYWNAPGIILERDSEVASFANLFTPLKGLSLSAAAQAEWTHQQGAGNENLDVGNPAIPGLFFPFPGTVNANQDRTEFSEIFDARFNRIPKTVLFADARLRYQRVGQFDEANNTLEPSQERTDALNHFYDARAGFTQSPWPWLEWGGDIHRNDSSTGYNHLVDNSPFAREGYPAFIRHRDVAMNEIEGRIVLRPVYWLNARLNYDWSRTDFSSATDPVSGGISSGGPIFDGRTELQNAGLTVTLMPVQRFYFSGAFTYGYSRTTTAPAASPEVVPYRGNLFTVSSSAGFVLNQKTDLNVTYDFSRSAYGQNNSAGIPLGLDFTRHELLVSLTRQLTKRLTGALRYQFSNYSEPGGGNVNNFTAQGIFATFVYRWP